MRRGLREAWDTEYGVFKILKDYFDKDYLMNPGGTLGLDLDEDKKKYLKEGITR